MIGHVQGGWEFIWAAYFVTWLGIAFFGSSLVPQGPLQLAWREVVGGLMALFAGIVVAALASVTGEPFIDRTILTVVAIGAGVALLGHAAMQFAQNRRKAGAAS